MDTKTRILEAARRQFNEMGTDAVTVRSIAQELGISHGNLCYHFANTDVIIHALYRQVVAEMSGILQQALEAVSELELMIKVGESSFHILYKYKFLMLDLVRIMRRIPQIREEHRALIKIRRQQQLELMKVMVAKGWLVPEPFPHYYEYLTERAFILTEGWIPYAEIHFDGNPEETIRHYYRIFINELLPLLTDEGYQQYEKVYAQYLAPK
ncbi:MAG: TetR/AcrR family transcriptional regulator [Saprospiraceae bacterium]